MELLIRVLVIYMKSYGLQLQLYQLCLVDHMLRTCLVDHTLRTCLVDHTLRTCLVDHMLRIWLSETIRRLLQNKLAIFWNVFI